MRGRASLLSRPRAEKAVPTAAAGGAGRPDPGRPSGPVSGLLATVTAAGLLLALAASAGPVRGQTPTEQGAAGFQEADDGDARLGWKGSADLGFTLTDGNSETTSLSVGGQVQYRLERQRWGFTGSYVRATTDGEETANKGDAELMYDFFPTSRFFVFAKTAGGFNRPAGLDLRFAPGAGVGYQILDSGGLGLAVEVGGEWTHDEFADGSSDDAARGSAAESFSWSVSETTDLEQSVTYRPDLGDPGDYLLDARLSLSTTIVAGLGLKVSFRDEFDSEPFVDPETGEAREKNDITFVTGLTYQF